MIQKIIRSYGKVCDENKLQYLVYVQEALFYPAAFNFMRLTLLTEFPLILGFLKLSNIFCFITAGCKIGVGSIDVSGLLG